MSGTYSSSSLLSLSLLRPHLPWRTRLRDSSSGRQGERTSSESPKTFRTGLGNVSLKVGPSRPANTRLDEVSSTATTGTQGDAGPFPGDPYSPPDLHRFRVRRQHKTKPTHTQILLCRRSGSLLPTNLFQDYEYLSPDRCHSGVWRPDSTDQALVFVLGRWRHGPDGGVRGLNPGVFEEEGSRRDCSSVGRAVSPESGSCETPTGCATTLGSGTRPSQGPVSVS